MPGHRRVIRTTNLLKRLFVEKRWSVRTAGLLFGERVMLEMMLSALAHVAGRWRGHAVTGFAKSQLERRAEQLRTAHLKETKPVAKPRSVPQPICSRRPTCPGTPPGCPCRRPWQRGVGPIPRPMADAASDSVQLTSARLTTMPNSVSGCVPLCADNARHRTSRSLHVLVLPDSEHRPSCAG